MANKTIKIAIDAPILPTGSGLTHISTSWEVSKIPNFTDPAYVILSDLQDTTNILEYRLSYDLQPSEPLYVRTKYHFSGGGASNWSRIIPLNADQIGIKLSSTVVMTPIPKVKVNYDANNNGTMVISTPTMKLYAGTGTHKSTSWEIVDTNGVIIFSRVNDIDNLTSISIDANLINSNKAYIVKVKHTTNTNSSSNYGKVTINQNSNSYSLFKLYMPYNMMPNSRSYFDLRLFTTLFQSIDIKIVDDTGVIRDSNYAQTSTTPYVDLSNLELYYSYSVYARLNLTDGSSTNYILIDKVTLLPNEVVPYSSTVTYLNKQSLTQETNLGGMVTQTARETRTQNIWLGKQQSDTLFEYRMISGKLVEVGPAASITGTNNILSKPYINIMPLYDGSLLVDYSSDVTNGIYRKSTFNNYYYNPIVDKLTYKSTLVREDERYATSLSSSAAVMPDALYYIPAKLVDVNENELPLELRKLDLVNTTMSTVGPLPVTIKRNVTFIPVDAVNIIMLGGTGSGVLVNNIEEFTRTNDNIYMYNTVNNTWTIIGTLTNVIPTSVYNLQGYERKDRKIVLFNAVNSGSSLGNQDSYVLDVTTGVVTNNHDDTLDTLAYQNTIALNSGDLLRISTRSEDPQKVYTYISDTIAASNVLDSAVIDTIVDLIVKPGETITIESPYRYNSITIQGTSLADTGTLEWLDGNTSRLFHYNDLIVTRSTTVTGGTSSYNSVTILDGAILTIA